MSPQDTSFEVTCHALLVFFVLPPHDPLLQSLEPALETKRVTIRQIAGLQSLVLSVAGLQLHVLISTSTTLLHSAMPNWLIAAAWK